MTKILVGILALFLVSLAQAQTPVVNAGGVVNTGSYASGGVAPGSIVSIFGTNLANQLATASTVPLPSTLANVQSVTFNGVTAGLYFVSMTQINAEVPWNVLPSGETSGTVNIVVVTSGGTSAAQSVSIVPAMPGIFTLTANGLGQGVATSSTDGDVAAPTASIAGVTSHPVQTGGYMIVWCTGLGQVQNPPANGGNPGSSQVDNTVLQPTVLVGGVQATFVGSALSPQYAGEYQIAVQLAANTPTGTAVSLQIQMNGVTSPNTVTIAVAPPSVQPTAATCTLTSTGCTAITLNGDPFNSTGDFAGYADPSIRQDPQTGTLWMAYSWTHTITASTGSYQGIDIHVSYSTDGGKTWNYQGALYTSQPVTNPVTGDADYTAHEVMNLLPEVINGVTYWIGIHSVYDVPSSNQGGDLLEQYSKRYEIAMAPGDATTGPMSLASATPQYLGQPQNTYPDDFPIAINLTTLNSQLDACTEYYEPALVMEGNNLYLFMSCSGGPVQGMFYAVFVTSNPQENPGNWTWSYVEQGANLFAGLSDALSVGGYLGQGATYITQMDIAPSKTPGVLLAIMTSAYNNSGGKVSLGCAAAELASIDPPMFVYNAQGQVQVDAIITSPDSEDNGPGSCTYSPFSATGMIMAHRQTSKAPQNGGFFTFLMQSFMTP